MPELHQIYTVGYQSFKKLEKLVELTREKDANLVDIRFRPWSKDEQWQSPSIQAAFLAAGLPGRYWWVRELGNVNYNNSEPIKLFDAPKGLLRIEEFALHRPVILMCACWDLMTCHRLVAAELLEKELGIAVEHVQAVSKEALPPDKPTPPVLAPAWELVTPPYKPPSVSVERYLRKIGAPVLPGFEEVEKVRKGK